MDSSKGFPDGHQLAYWVDLGVWCALAATVGEVVAALVLAFASRAATERLGPVGLMSMMSVALAACSAAAAWSVFRVKLALAELDEPDPGRCLRAVVKQLMGLSLPVYVSTFEEVGELLELGAGTCEKLSDAVVRMEIWGWDDPRNHVAVDPSRASPDCVMPSSECLEGTQPQVSYASIVDLVQRPSPFVARVVFYAASSELGEQFGQMFGEGTGTHAAGHAARDQARPEPPGSVVDESVSHGATNVTGGVVRPPRRVIRSRAADYAQKGLVHKGYSTSQGVQFNNISELFQDRMSRDCAQEVLESVFSAWGMPSLQPAAMTYAENLVWTFLIAVSGSDKADYDRQFFVPVKPFDRNGQRVDEIVADMKILSDTLAAPYGATRRQFCRAVADDMRRFIKAEGNEHLLPELAARAGCEQQMAHLAFDGSTHCSGLNTRELGFVKTLEARNLFERDDELAQGASVRMMQGVVPVARATR